MCARKNCFAAIARPPQLRSELGLLSTARIACSRPPGRGCRKDRLDLNAPEGILTSNCLVRSQVPRADGCQRGDNVHRRTSSSMTAGRSGFLGDTVRPPMRDLCGKWQRSFGAGSRRRPARRPGRESGRGIYPFDESLSEADLEIPGLRSRRLNALGPQDALRRCTGHEFLADKWLTSTLADGPVSQPSDGGAADVH
jgi:hypothetical protein